MIRVLIVEDDFRVAEIHRAYLERLPGFSVIAEAHTAAEALRLAEESLPKGLSPTTLTLVVRALRDAVDDVSAVDIARTTGISRVTSRRYLDHLARSGVVAISMRYGSAGRPEHRYRLAAAVGERVD